MSNCILKLTYYPSLLPLTKMNFFFHIYFARIIFLRGYTKWPVVSLFDANQDHVTLEVCKVKKWRKKTVKNNEMNFIFILYTQRYYYLYFKFKFFHCFFFPNWKNIFTFININRVTSRQWLTNSSYIFCCRRFYSRNDLNIIILGRKKKTDNVERETQIEHSMKCNQQQASFQLTDETFSRSGIRGENRGLFYCNEIHWENFSTIGVAFTNGWHRSGRICWRSGTAVRIKMERLPHQHFELIQAFEGRGRLHWCYHCMRRLLVHGS